ncbi:MAG: hemerythrin domain-containing protein [Comamonas sp.]
MASTAHHTAPTSAPQTRATSSTLAQPAATARRKAVAKARALAPGIPAAIGSTPRTQFRGNPDIFGRLVEDHDRHRALLAMITATSGASPERKKLFKELVKELKSHAAAEEQALWSSVMRNPQTTPDARHAVGEHKEIDKLLDDLAARDMASSGWLRRFAGLHEEYLHHIKEEEQEQFVSAQKHLSDSDVRYMKQVFNRRKREEKAAAKVAPKIRRQPA